MARLHRPGDPLTKNIESPLPLTLRRKQMQIVGYAALGGYFADVVPLMSSAAICVNSHLHPDKINVGQIDRCTVNLHGIVYFESV
jgi:predicted esterase YcpF (UPF0227 family)